MRGRGWGGGVGVGGGVGEGLKMKRWEDDVWEIWDMMCGSVVSLSVMKERKKERFFWHSVIDVGYHCG